MLYHWPVGTFYPHLSDQRFTSALGLVHSRFSTNTFPSWPSLLIRSATSRCGEINTVKGNRNWMTARGQCSPLSSSPATLERLFPICTPVGSDSASFDEVLELLYPVGEASRTRC